MSSDRPVAAAAAIARHPDWREALADVLARVRGQVADTDLAVLFASASYAQEFSELIEQARQTLRSRVLIGCSGQGVIGPSTEIEGEPALTLLALSLPDALLETHHLSQAELQQCDSVDATRDLLGVPPDDVNAWLLLADPYTLDAERLLDVLSASYPGVPLLGGMASGDAQARRTHLFLDGQVYENGAIALAIGGPLTIRSIVSQGCNPIGRAWTITGTQEQIIKSIAGRPALEVLIETIEQLPEEERQRAQQNLLIGLAMDEYREDFGRGDFLIRNLLGADRESGAIAVSALPREGQTLQFQVRDAAAADEDLRLLLQEKRAAPPGEELFAALLWSCNGRGQGLFGSPDHDAKAVADILGPIPLAGFFCNGEIGPVGSKNFLHGFTASIALFSK
jgi:small ligand-binding sensory domain FIST